MAELFQCTPENILVHLRNIFQEGELTPEATAKEFLAVRQEGARMVQRSLKYYNLDAIIAVGYEKNERRARFIWSFQKNAVYLQGNCV